MPISLSQRFFDADAGDVTVCADSDLVRSWAEDQGHSFLHMAQALDNSPTNCVMVATTKFWYSQLSVIRSAMSSAAVLWLPLNAFDGQPKSISYGLHQLDNVDWEQTLQRQREVASMVGARGFELHDIAGPRASLVMNGEASVSFGQTGPIPVGGFDSLLQHLEVETEYIRPDSSLKVSGSVTVDCLLYAVGPRTVMNPAESSLVKGLCQEVANSASTIHFEDSVVSRFDIGERDRLDDLISLAGPSLQNKVTEFSWGLNPALVDIDWSINSPFNEGAYGVHFGVGDGYSGVHLDFVCAGIRTSAVA